MNKEEKDNNYWNGYIKKQKESIEICKMCKYRKRYKELKQKETILDKVTEKLKKVGNKYIKEYKNVEKLDLIQQNTAVLQELSCVIDDIEEILEIIEGEKE